MSSLSGKPGPRIRSPSLFRPLFLAACHGAGQVCRQHVLDPVRLAQQVDLKSGTKINFGVNTKIIHRIAGNFASAWGFGFDAAAQMLLTEGRLPPPLEEMYLIRL